MGASSIFSIIRSCVGLGTCFGEDQGVDSVMWLRKQAVRNVQKVINKLFPT
jgi:hypothetical protein